MTCQLSLIGQISELSSLKKFLFPDKYFALAGDDGNGAGQPVTSDEGADVDWTSSDWDSVSQKEPEDENWLGQCQVSISPLVDLLAIGYKNRLAILECCWDDSDMPSFRKSWKGIVSEFSNEVITAVLCLPIVSHKQSTQGAPEWTCAIVGFDTGFIRIYTEAGSRVLSQQLHSDPVSSISCRMYIPPRHASPVHCHEELVVLYSRSLVTVEGLSLYLTLRACRNQAAKAAANQSGVVQPPPLPFKHYSLSSQEHATSVAFAGEHTSNPFDQMQAASLHGFREHVSPEPPSSLVYVCGGTNPYLAFYHVLEGDSQPLIHNVSQAASKLLSYGKSALLSWGSKWIGGGKQEQAQEPRQIASTQTKEPAVKIEPRFSLYDKKRECLSLNLSPCGSMAAVTDSLGRVLLVDTVRSVALRQWKGYRNAQVSWVSVSDPKGPRAAIFLVIYAPKRGLLEVWLTQQGPRVAAFNTHRDCCLLHVGCSILGLNSTSGHALKARFLTCCLVHNSGDLFTVEIPFHLALSDSNSKRAHDMQLLRTIKSILKRGDESTFVESVLKELCQHIKRLKLSSSKQQAVDSVCLTKCMTLKGCQFVLTGVTEVLDKIDPDAMDLDTKSLVGSCKKYSSLLQTYTSLKEWHEKPPCNKKIEEAIDHLRPQSEVLLSLEKARLFADSSARKTAVKFSPPVMGSALFLSIFYNKAAHQEGSASVFNGLEKDVQQSLGAFIYKPYLSGKVDLSDIKAIRGVLEMSLADALCLLLSYHFLSSELTPSYILRLEGLVHAFQTEWFQVNHIDPEAEEVSGWTKVLLTACNGQSNMAAAICLAFTARSLSLKRQEEVEEEMNVELEKEEENEEKDSEKEQTEDKDKLSSVDNPTDKDGEVSADAAPAAKWQYMSLDASAWSVCLDRLISVGYLNQVLEWTPGAHAASMQPVSVQDVLDSSKGIVCELVGRWAVGCKLDPSFFQTLEKAKSTSKFGTEDPLLGLFSAFPLSFNVDALHANLAWEYQVVWKKDKEVLAPLAMSLEFLRQIESGLLRHGICSLMWDTFLCQKFKSIALLIEKVHKAPKDRIAKKELSMETATASEFMGHMTTFLQIFLEANCTMGQRPIETVEEVWLSENQSQSLIELSCNRRESNYLLVLLHHSVSVILHGVLNFSLKSVRPLRDLFDKNSVHALFTDLSSRPYLNPDEGNRVLAAPRLEFLIRLIEGAISTLPPREQCFQPDGSLLVDPSADWPLWTARILELAEVLQVDKQALVEAQVYGLYCCGYDSLGGEALLGVFEKRDICERLLTVASQRLSYHLLVSDSDQTALYASQLTPHLYEWLKTQNYSELKVYDFPLDATKRLITTLLNHTPESSDNFKRTLDLYNFLNVI